MNNDFFEPQNVVVMKTLSRILNLDKVGIYRVCFSPDRNDILFCLGKSQGTKKIQ